MADLTLQAGQSKRLFASDILANDSLFPPDQPVVWSTDSPEIVSLIDAASNGASITAISFTVGTATLTVSIGLFTKTFVIDVVAVPSAAVVGITIEQEVPEGIPLTSNQRSFPITVSDNIGQHGAPH